MAAHLQQDRPSRWVERFAPLVPPGRVLDVACGGGRHARLFAALGHPVLAVDRDVAALAASEAPGIDVRQVDLEHEQAAQAPGWPLIPDSYAGVVVTNYLHRPLFPALLRSLAADGVLIYETFALGNALFGKPSNPDFLLAPGELLAAAAAFPGLRILAYEDGHVTEPKPAMVQRICVRRASDALSPEACAL